MSETFEATITLPDGTQFPVSLTGDTAPPRGADGAVVSEALPRETVSVVPDAPDYWVLIMLAGLCAWCREGDKTITITGDAVEVAK